MNQVHGQRTLSFVVIQTRVSPSPTEWSASKSLKTLSIAEFFGQTEVNGI